jgi:hypothetical protein
MRSTALATLALLVVAGLLACDDPPQSLIPEPNGMISGLVRGPHGPIAGVELEARPLDPGIARLRPTAVSGRDGEYVLSVPLGSYLLSAKAPTPPSDIWYGADSLSLRPREADTLLVTAAEEPVRADFVLGDLEVGVLVPRELRRGRLELWAEAEAQSIPTTREAGPVEARFKLRGLAPGRYRLRLKHTDPEGNRSAFYLPPTTHDPGEAEGMQVVANDVTEWRGSVPAPGHLRGRVLGSWRETARDLPLILVEGPHRGVALSHTDERGAFEVPIFAPGRVLVYARMGSEPVFFGQGGPYNPAQFEVGPGRDADVGTVTLGGMRIRLSGYPVPRPLPRIWIHQIRIHDAEGRTLRPQIGIQDGSAVTVSGLTPGSYFLQISQPIGVPWRPQWYDRASSLENARPLVMGAAGDLIEVEVRLEEGGVIEGRVLDPDGEVAAPVRIEAEAVTTDFGIRPVEASESDGSFRIQGLPDDEIRLWATSPGYVVTYYPGTASFGEAESIPIRLASRVRWIEWRLIRE